MSKYVLFLMVIFVSVGAFASEITVTDDPVTSAKVIWIEAEDYDSKTAEYVVDSEVILASDLALYCPTESGSATTEPYWMEYSIDSTDPALSGVALDGTTWYAWARVNQPEADGFEAQWLLVKGDSGDGSGAGWYDTAVAGVVYADDCIANSISSKGGAGPGQWAWIGDDTAGLEKDFNLDADNKIVFRINEREGGPGNGRIDAIALASEPNFVPTDGDFGRTVVSNGLVFMADASVPGDSANTNWQPLIGSGDGDLDGPAIGVENGSSAGTYTWFYNVDGTVKESVENIDVTGILDFGADEGYTCEAWVRVPDKMPEGAGRGTIIGHKSPGDTGWRLSLRDVAGTGAGIEFHIRDNETILSEYRGTIHRFDTGATIAYDNQWHHIVAHKSASTFAGTDRIYSYFDTWIDGVRSNDNIPVAVTGVTDLEDFTFADPVGGAARLGFSPTIYAFDGDIAVVRVYNRELTDAEVLSNYNAGIDSTVDSICGGADLDLTEDCKVNVADLAELATDWLIDATITP